MHTGISISLGKMQYHILICFLLKEDYQLESGQSVLGFSVSKYRVINLNSYRTLTFFPCPGLSLCCGAQQTVSPRSRPLPFYPDLLRLIDCGYPSVAQFLSMS